jgi:CubicO group peptidase (beta-lactamase class C family)
MEGLMMNRTVCFLACLLLAAIVGAQMPDSPTGRMADALAELANSEGDAALADFLDTRVAATARPKLEPRLAALRRECAGTEIRGARKTGNSAAVITLALTDGRCEVAFEIEGAEPFALVGLGLDVMLGDGGDEGGMGLDLPSGDDTALAQALDRQLTELAADGSFSGVVLMARDGKTFFNRAYGQADRERGLANEPDTRFDIGSITKMMTKVAVAQLAQAGQLALDDTVHEHLPDYPDREIATKITIRQLLDHSSGLGDIFNERWDDADKSRLETPQSFFPLFSGEPLQFEPGASRSYSNAGYIVLGAIVEAASGEAYADYLDEHLFRPAGMSRSGFPLRDGTAPDLAIGYTRQGEDGTDGERPNLGLLPIRGCPAGSSSHTAADLLRFDQALRSGRLLDARWTAWVYSDQLPEAGSDGPRDWGIAVAGGGPGVSAVLETDGTATAIVLANQDPPVATDLGRELFQALRGDR